MEAKPGGNGKTKKMHGANGEDYVVKVPQGTIVKNLKSGHMIADLTQPGQEAVIARGGKGGRGNFHFRSTRHRAAVQRDGGARRRV